MLRSLAKILAAVYWITTPNLKVAKAPLPTLLVAG